MHDPLSYVTGNADPLTGGIVEQTMHAFNHHVIIPIYKVS